MDSNQHHPIAARRRGQIDKTQMFETELRNLKGSHATLLAVFCSTAFIIQADVTFDTCDSSPNPLLCIYGARMGK